MRLAFCLLSPALLSGAWAVLWGVPWRAGRGSPCSPGPMLGTRGLMVVAGGQQLSAPQLLTRGHWQRPSQGLLSAEGQAALFRLCNGVAVTFSQAAEARAGDML